MKNPDVKGQLVVSAFLGHLVRWCDLSTCSTLQREAASELFSTLVNKYTDGGSFTPIRNMLRCDLPWRCF